MTKAAIITIPHPQLRTRSKRVSLVDQSIAHLARDMISATLDWEASRQHEIGAALAAIQIGQPYRVVVIRHDFDNREDKSFDVFINPEIVKLEGEPVEELEGCLSVADIYGQVARYPKVKVKALNLDGKPVRITAHGFLARVFQHEIDHINGLVFVDRVTDPAKLFRLEENGEFSTIKTP